MSTKKPISKTKYATTVLVKCKSPPLNADDIFSSLFFKSVDLAQKAKRFYNQVLESKGVPEKEWMKMIEQLEIDRGTYYHMISKLRGVGLIEKREGFWVGTTHFRAWLEQMLRQVAAVDGYNTLISYDKRE